MSLSIIIIIIIIIIVKTDLIKSPNQLSGPGQAPRLLAQYPVRREWFRPKTLKCLLVVSEVRRLKTLNATVLTQPFTMYETQEAKSKVFALSKQHNSNHDKISPIFYEPFTESLQFVGCLESRICH